MSKTILVGYDGASSRPADAVALAHALAKLQRATVVDPGPTSAEALVALAEGHDSGLIVIGSSRRSRPGGVMPDRGVQTLIDVTSHPLAIAPLGFEHRSSGELRHVGVAYDGSRGARAALDLAAGLVASGSGWLELLAVAEPRVNGSVGASSSGNGNGRRSHADLERAVADALEGMRDQIHVLAETVYGIPTRTLLNRTAALDLFVVGSRADDVAGDPLGSVTTGLLAGEARCPVLVAPPSRHDRSARSTSEAALTRPASSPAGGAASRPS
jgi:nucleotide-binding universal stress UspA family protein